MHYTLFPTAIGTCAIAWDQHGIRATRLPESSHAAMLRWLQRIEPDALEQRPPAAIARTLDDITALLAGEPRDLRAAIINVQQQPPFFRRVYAIVRTIAPGRTLTYGEVAARCGEPRAARAVGQAMGRNPFPIIVPCHRVLGAHGSGGFSASGGVRTKLRLLAIEGVTPAQQRLL